MTSLHFSGLKRVLALGAHADDLEIGCFGTLQKIKNAGVPIDCLLLSGSAERQQEQAKSLSEWGIHARYYHLSFADGLFPAQSPEIKEAIKEFISDHSYDLVLVHNRQDHHQDHYTLGQLAYNIFRNTLVWEYEIPKYDIDTPQPNVFIPLTEDELGAKVRHLAHNFASQATKAWYSDETFRGLARLRGIQCNAAFAEAFICRKFVVSL
jgi:LmbE family N-acetylglucosaminyl deacetylase